MVSPADNKPVLIAGGGIGGLAAALALAQKGIASLVLEKARARRDRRRHPARAQCLPLLRPAGRRRGGARHGGLYRPAAPDGCARRREITTFDLGEAFRARFGNPYAVVHRGDLHGVLLKACQDHALIELRTSAEVVGYDQDGTAVTARLANGERVRARPDRRRRAVVERARQVVGDGPPRVSGHTTYRSVIPTEQMPGGSALERGHAVGRPEVPHRPLPAVGLEGVQPRRHLSQRCARAGRRQAGAGRGGAARLRPCLRARAETSSATARTGSCGCCATAIRSSKWIDGRVALLGDAAHPMLQYMAQGACMAMEDAVCLSQMLAQYRDDHGSALEAYRARASAHRARAAAVARHRRARLPSRRRARPLRNAIMSAKTSEDYYGHLAWLYGGTGLGD